MFKLFFDEETKVPMIKPSGSQGQTLQAAYRQTMTGPSFKQSAPTNVIASTPPSNNATTIDIVKDYDWKVSPNNDLIEQPYIILKEYRINKSPMASKLLYLLQSAKTGFIGKANISLNLNSVIGDLVNLVNPEAIDKSLTDIINSIANSAGANIENLSPHLDPFEGLYFTKETDFTYKMPYFTEKMIRKSGRWDRNYSGDASNVVTDTIQQGLDFVAKHGAGIPGIGAVAEPGIYIERSQYYQPTAGGNPIDFSFPLLNTLNPESIQKNFEFIWLLLFQNSVIRKNKTDVLPPCIYRVLVPGIRFILYAYIENISIEYIGTRRRMPIIHPVTGLTIETIIPEAYNIYITIENLTTDSSNFMLSSLTDNL